MVRLDPMIKLAVVVAFGVAATMLLGVGKPTERDKLVVINKSQTPVEQISSHLKANSGMSLLQD